MIDNVKMQGILDLFGSTLPPRSLFFATRQSQEFITPAFLKGFYHEPALPKAYAKFLVDFEEFAATKTKPQELVKKPQPVKVAPTVVTKDA